METPGTWVKQGAPEEILDSRFRRKYFQFDHMRELREIQSGLYIDKRLDIRGANYVYAIPPIIPSYDPRFLDEDEHTITLTNEGGQKARVFKDDPQKMPMYLDHPVKDRASWEEYKKRLDPNTPERWPSDWNAYVEKMNGRDEPTLLHVGGFFGFLREWTGLERLLLMFYDDPNLIEDMMEQICYLETECIRRTLKDIRVDGAMFWDCLLYTSPSPRDGLLSRMPSSA